VNKALHETANMVDSGKSYSLQEKMTLSARILAVQGHGSTLSGQITCRDTNTSDELLMYVSLYANSF